MKRNPVTPELRRYVLLRDGQCAIVKLGLERSHICRDAYGTEHWPDDLDRLTLEHVKDELRMGVRAPSDARHLLALCANANVRVPSKVWRQAFRRYLARVEPGVAA